MYVCVCESRRYVRVYVCVCVYAGASAYVRVRAPVSCPVLSMFVWVGAKRDRKSVV